MPIIYPSEFDPQLYVTHPFNRDLRRLGTEAARKHYYEKGQAEGRFCGHIDGRRMFFSLVGSDRSILEMGPSFSPSFVKATHKVSHMDIFSTEELRARAAANPEGIPERVPEIDYIDTGARYEEIVDRKFDVAFSSHVIEHQPDLVSHLNNVSSILAPDGEYFLAVPDHRYCFDHFLPPSNIAMVMDAHMEKRTLHTACSIIEHWFLTTHNDAQRHWIGDHGPDPSRTPLDAASLEKLQSILAHVAVRNGYIDVHNWKFTPQSFRSVIDMLWATGYTDLKVERVYGTFHQANEFFAILRKTPRAA